MIDNTEDKTELILMSIRKSLEIRVRELKRDRLYLEKNDALTVSYQINWIEEAIDIIRQYRKLI